MVPFLKTQAVKIQGIKKNKLDYIKMKKLCIEGHNQQSEKATYRMGKYLQVIYFIRDLFLECIKEDKSTTENKQPS